MRYAILVLIAALGSLSCVRTAQVVSLNQVDIAAAAALVLPTSAQMQTYLDATQLISGTFSGSAYTMQVQLEWRPGSMAMAALGVWGTAVFSIGYDGRELEIRGNPELLRGLKAEYVLADILLTYWDYSKLSTNLRGEAISVVDLPTRRNILRNGMPIITIDYEQPVRWDGRVRYQHLERGYVLEIDTLGYSES